MISVNVERLKLLISTFTVSRDKQRIEDKTLAAVGSTAKNVTKFMLGIMFCYKNGLTVDPSQSYFLKGSFQNYHAAAKCTQVTKKINKIISRIIQFIHMY